MMVYEMSWLVACFDAGRQGLHVQEDVVVLQDPQKQRHASRRNELPSVCHNEHVELACQDHRHQSNKARAIEVSLIAHLTTATG